MSSTTTTSTIQTATITLSPADDAEAQRLLRRTAAETRAKYGATPMSRTATFDDGIEVDLDIVNGADGPWINAVLFENGQEVLCLEPRFGDLCGTYTFPAEAATYVVVVERPAAL